ncbi:YcxB family protein, partial [Acinetobacter baumannii]
EAFTINFSEHYIVLENNRGYVNWEWSKFSKFIESPHFFHLYFDTKSFFLVPKDTMMDDDKHTVRGLLKEKIG